MKNRNYSKLAAVARAIPTKMFGVCQNPRIWLSIALLGIILSCAVGPLKILFDRDFLVKSFQIYNNYAVILFVFLYTLLTVIGIPGTVLTVAGGLVFGLVWGTFWSVVGATLGALGAFWTARYLLRDRARNRFGKHRALLHFDRAVVCQPFTFVLALRFAPLFPFNIINFLFGLTPIHWIPYTVATFFGIIPGTLAYTWLGVSGSNAIQGGDRLSFLLALSFLAFLSILPLCFNKK